jgi:hypothetical protein
MKTIPMLLRLNQETRASHLLVHGADYTQLHLTSRSFSHRVSDLCDHPCCSAPGLLLLLRSSSLPAMPHLPHAHRETSKHDSPHEQDKGKTIKTVLDSNSNPTKSMTHHNQTKKLITWFLTDRSIPDTWWHMLSWGVYS